jgi:hypothetical protein
MSATNPFKVSDLIHKYGWDTLPYLSNLGVHNLAEAQVLFVDSGHTNALDADDTEHGHLLTKPLATVDYAIGLCTASEQSIILVAPGHVEDYDDSTTGFDADVAGIQIIGLGSGSLRPRFDFNDSTSKCIVGANDVTLRNLVFRPSVATVAIGLDIETGITGCTLEDIEFAMGEKGDGTDEFVKALHLTSGNHDTRLKNVKILAHADCDGTTHGIHVDAASNRLTFDNVVIDGPFTNGIAEDAAGLNHILVDCSVDVDTTNYGFNVSSTFAKRTRNLDGGASEDTAENLIGRNDSNNAADTSNVVDNQDGSLLERLEDIKNHVEDPYGRTASETFYVDAAISSSGDGSSWENAFKTISEAVAVATTAGDTIIVAPGDYDEDATVAISTNGLRIIGPGPNTQNRAMLYGNAGAYDLMTINANEVEINGLAFSDATDTYDGIVIGGSSSSYKVWIHNCRFDGWDGEYGIQAGASNDCPDLLIENNLFRSWNTAAVQVNCTRSCVRNNIFHVVTDKIGLEHVPSGSNRPDNVYLDNRFSGASNSSTTGIKFTGAPSDGTCMVGGNWFFGTWNTSITQVAGSIGILNYVSDTDTGGTLIDTSSS